MKLFSRNKSRKKKRIMVRDKRHKKIISKSAIHWAHFGQITAMWILAVLIFYGVGLRSTALTDLGIGQRAPRSVVASVDFTCEDLAETDRVRSLVAKETSPAFTVSNKPWIEAERFLNHLESRVKQFHTAEAGRIEASRAAIDSLLELMGLELTPNDFDNLSDTEKIEASISTLKQVLSETLAAPLIDKEDKVTQFQGLVQAGKIVIYHSNEVLPDEIALNEIKTVALARKHAVSLSRQQIPEPILSDHVLNVIAARWITPNLIYNRAQTARLVKDAVTAVDPITETVIIGSTIVEAHQTITPQALTRLRSHEKRISETESR